MNSGYRIPDTGQAGTSAGSRLAPRIALSGLRFPASAIGFTLLELLLSLALIGMLLVAMNQFIFSMGELWGRGADVRLFDRHVRAVTRFMEKTLHATVLPSARGVQALAIQDLRLPEGPMETLLTFRI